VVVHDRDRKFARSFFRIYARTIGLSVVAITRILGIQLVATLVWKPISEWVSDRIGRKPMIVVGLLLGAADLPAIVNSRNPILLGALSLALGLSVATVTPSTNAFVADLVKSRSLGSAMGVSEPSGTQARREAQSWPARSWRRRPTACRS